MDPCTGALGFCIGRRRRVRVSGARPPPRGTPVGPCAGLVAKKAASGAFRASRRMGATTRVEMKTRTPHSHPSAGPRAPIAEEGETRGGDDDDARCRLESSEGQGGLSGVLWTLQYVGAALSR